MLCVLSTLCYASTRRKPAPVSDAQCQTTGGYGAITAVVVHPNNEIQLC